MSKREKPVGIIGSMDLQIEHYLKNSEPGREIRWNEFIFHESTLFGKNTVIVKSGVGKVFAAMVCERLIDEFDPQAVIFTGVAGALNKELDIGDVVLSSSCIQHDLDAQALGFMRGAIPYTEHRVFKADENLLSLASQTKLKGKKIIAGRILTGDQFITKREMRDHKYLIDELKGDAIEMEGGSIAQVCTLNSIPFLIVRTLSDKADGTAVEDFNKLLVCICKGSIEIKYKNLVSHTQEYTRMHLALQGKDSIKI